MHCARRSVVPISSWAVVMRASTATCCDRLKLIGIWFLARSLSLPPILSKMQKMPAAIMYFAFFAVGVLSGTLLTGGKKGGASGKSKTQN
jgi:hypothetical protein